MSTMNNTTVYPGSLRAWLLASRPATLVAAVIPVWVGCSVAYSMAAFRPLPALAALLGAIGIQIGTNFANDVYDFKNGADTHERVGPMRAAQAGLLRPEQLFLGMFVAFGAAALVGAYLFAIAGWPVAVIGIASIVSGIAYTGGPWPLGYNGLGDVFVFVFFGFVAVCGTVYVQAGAVAHLALLVSIPVGCLATGILVINNIRDADTDVLCGKRTLAVRFGRRVARAEYVLLNVLAFAVPLVLFLTGATSGYVLLCWLSAPLGMQLVRVVCTHSDAQTLNVCLKKSAALLSLHGVLFALGLLWAG